MIRISEHFEWKYLVDPARRDEVLLQIQPHVRPDPHGVNGTYWVTSQYFDTQDVAAYWETLDRVPTRRKLRLRFYGDYRSPTSPPVFFLEVKARRLGRVRKERVALTRFGATRILEDASALRDLSAFVADGSALDSTVADVQSAAAHCDLGAAVVVSYRRRAWIGAEDKVRVTFDECVVGGGPASYQGVPPAHDSGLIPPGACVLEVKFPERPPTWWDALARSLDLESRSFSKYVHAVGIQQVLQRGDFLDGWKGTA